MPAFAITQLGPMRRLGVWSRAQHTVVLHEHVHMCVKLISRSHFNQIVRLVQPSATRCCFDQAVTFRRFANFGADWGVAALVRFAASDARSRALPKPRQYMHPDNYISYISPKTHVHIKAHVHGCCPSTIASFPIRSIDSNI